MSELKTYKMVDEKYCADCVCVIPSEVYLKSEADEMIEQLKDKARHYPMLVLIIEDAKRDLLRQAKEIRHQKHRRCLAMAKWCKAEADAAFLRYNWDNGRYAEVDFYEKWHKRWLELAEKFKPNNSTAQQGKGIKYESNEETRDH